jgi:hypothetical protein
MNDLGLRSGKGFTFPNSVLVLYKALGTIICDILDPKHASCMLYFKKN